MKCYLYSAIIISIRSRLRSKHANKVRKGCFEQFSSGSNVTLSGAYMPPTVLQFWNHFFEQLESSRLTSLMRINQEFANLYKPLVAGPDTSFELLSANLQKEIENMTVDMTQASKELENLRAQIQCLASKRSVDSADDSDSDDNICFCNLCGIAFCAPEKPVKTIDLTLGSAGDDAGDDNTNFDDDDDMERQCDTCKAVFAELTTDEQNQQQRELELNLLINELDRAREYNLLGDVQMFTAIQQLLKCSISRVTCPKTPNQLICRLFSMRSQSHR
jgi:hypothetical protein